MLFGCLACLVERRDRSTLPLTVLAREVCAIGMMYRLLLPLERRSWPFVV